MMMRSLSYQCILKGISVVIKKPISQDDLLCISKNLEM